jgi:hypothetical protein
MNARLETTFHNWCARAYSAVDVLWQSFFAVHLGPKVSSMSAVLADRPAIAVLVEHLTVECRSNQMVPCSIPGGRNLARVRAPSLQPASNGFIVRALRSYQFGIS